MSTMVPLLSQDQFSKSKDDISMLKTKQRRTYVSPHNSVDLQRLIGMRNRTFVAHTLEIIEHEITYHRRNALFQIMSIVLWTLMIVCLFQMWQTRRFFNIWLACPIMIFGFYTCIVVLDVKEHVMQKRWWEQAMDALLEKDEAASAFDSYLDRIPRELKGNLAYKSIRRKHFELSCNLGVTRRVFL